MNRRGQVAVYLLMVIVAIALFALLNVDSFLAVRTKNRAQNGGDAAALAAARRQGEIIDEIGRLNIAHFRAAFAGDWRKCAAIEQDQRRMALLEPVYALEYASEAAKRNGLPVRDDFAEILDMHVRDVRLLYSSGGGDTDPYPESYPGAWGEYASAIDEMRRQGLAACADNVEYYDVLGSHLLLRFNFYNAIAAEDWCWFLFHCEGEGALNHYNSYGDWGALATSRHMTTENSEIFSLHLKARRGALAEVFTEEELDMLGRRFGLKMEDADFSVTNLFKDASQTWFFFDESYWGQWFDNLKLIGDEEGETFPIAGTVKPEYNVRGAAAVCRVAQTVESFAADTPGLLSWSAAAKPFGTIEDFGGEQGPVTCLKGFVLPCMRDTRLVPVDAAGGAYLATADIFWVKHLREHLPEYMRTGPRSNGGCFYCAQLIKWERESFRKRGIKWLKYHAGECVRPLDGPSARGGTSHGH